MTNLQKAQKSVSEASRLLREKSPDSTLAERYFLLYEAWDEVASLPQPLQMGKGLYYILSKASLPIEEYDLLLGRYDDHVPSEQERKRLEELWKRDPYSIPIVAPNGGHRTLEWETLLEKGITGYLAETEARIRRAESESEEERVLVFLEGMRWIYKAILLYIKRYEEAARRAGLPECAAICRELTEDRPKSFRAALQLILFVYNIYLIYAGSRVACLNVGRLDNILLAVYENDLKSGALTREDAGTLIDDFSAKMSLHLGRGEHQMAYLSADYVHTGWLRNHVFDSPGYITVGGYSETADHRTNPLTRLFLEHIHPELKNPVYVFRMTADTESDIWDILCDKLKENASILVYNDETMIPAYTHIGVERADAVNYSVHPCNWGDITGDSIIFDRNDDPMPAVINEALKSGGAPRSMDELYERIVLAFASKIKPLFERFRKKYPFRKSMSNGNIMLDDCFAKGVISYGEGLRNGAARYPAVYVVLRNIGTAADMLSAIDTLVFRNKVCTFDELMRAAEDNFESCPQILAACQRAPKYGTDDAAADIHAVRLMNELLDLIDRESLNEAGQRDIYTLNVTIADSMHIARGAEMGATVDGRRSGAPLSENLSGTVGYSKGVTPLLNSASKLPFNRMHSGALNLRLQRSIVSGKEGALRIRALLQTYFERGGMQLQLSIADTDELRRAQQTPDDYRDLLVRITGYSAVFVDMSRGAQDEFIRREELK